jgi:outer membrane biosynthesis protein TonB
MKSIRMRPAFCVATLLFLVEVDQLQCAEGLRPAVIGNGADSVAAKLHYPSKERDSKTEAVVVFFCEVGTDGKAKNVRTYWNQGYNRFGDAVEKALNQGRFTPAMVGGKPTPVLIGGTVFFVARGDRPTVVISMATADKQKAAAMQNYIQPQMIGSDADLRRKLMNAARAEKVLVNDARANAEVLAKVDANGNLLDTKLVAESSKNGGWGAILMKAMSGARFIPASNNGTPEPGEFTWAVRYNETYDPDHVGTGSHVRHESE